ncbi:hypothetical protein [Methylobacterium longum]|uniref:Uncharacterized protein n=1 Tax=Methylobacterium longum TaxID=767694 RepID=A0ABT8ATN1_9HYPH|nr:hypothetical protein [Methylobacterium longum]MDN3572965.1 hypothetical protein [Methylobacterium longum]GJE14552.1 hypothetical protein FOHLNKBM_5627 [Methylobacterium longum]
MPQAASAAVDARPLDPLPCLNQTVYERNIGWEAQFVPMPWIEAIVAINEDIIACERRFHDQCALVVARAVGGQVTAEDEMLLASYMTSLTLVRAHRNSLLSDISADA